MNSEFSEPLPASLRELEEGVSIEYLIRSPRMAADAILTDWAEELPLKDLRIVHDVAEAAEYSNELRIFRLAAMTRIANGDSAAKRMFNEYRHADPAE